MCRSDGYADVLAQAQAVRDALVNHPVPSRLLSTAAGFPTPARGGSSTGILRHERSDVDLGDLSVEASLGEAEEAAMLRRVLRRRATPRLAAG